MNVFLSSPGSQLHAHILSEAGVPTLISYASWKPWMEGYESAFDRVLYDSGAYSELTGKKKVDIGEYRAWSERRRDKATAIAGLDDIRGDWRRSLKNYAEIPWAFPTMHEADPPELLKDLIAIAREQGRWIGLGLTPPRSGKERWVRWACDQIPDDLHVHGWAMREYTHVRRLNSTDSTNWLLDAMAIKRDLPWLTFAEALEILVKRYVRWNRMIVDDAQHQMEFTA